MDSITPVLEALAGATHIAQVAEVVRNAARALIGADGVTFVIREGDRCRYMEEDAITPLWKGQAFPMSKCVSGWVMQHKEPVKILDVFTDSRVLHDVYRQTFVRSMAMVPIGNDKPIGAIGAYWARPHEATLNEMEMLQAMADSAALALSGGNAPED
jgi:GAF domain-containing protein